MSTYRVLTMTAVLALLAATPLSAKTLIYCSEGSPENFYPGINTTGTSFDANSQIYSRIVDFERGSTNVVPGLAEKWEISEDGTVYTFHLRKGVKQRKHAKNRVGLRHVHDRKRALPFGVEIAVRQHDTLRIRGSAGRVEHDGPDPARRLAGRHRRRSNKSTCDRNFVRAHVDGGPADARVAVQVNAAYGISVRPRIDTGRIGRDPVVAVGEDGVVGDIAGARRERRCRARDKRPRSPVAG